MGTTLRMLWGTAHREAVDLADLRVVDWAEEIGRRHVSSLPERGARVRASDGGRFVLARDRHDAPRDPEITAAVRLDVVDTRDDGRRTRTRVRAWRGPAPQTDEGVEAWVLVDVEVLDPPDADAAHPTVPEFVPGLLARLPGGRGGTPLPASILRLPSAAAVEDLIRPAGRDVPVVVVESPRDPAPSALRVVETAAHQAARALAGIAVVVLAPAGANPGAMVLQVPSAPGYLVGAERVARPGEAARTARELLGPRSADVALPRTALQALDRLGPQVPDELVEKMAEVPRDRYPFAP
ncbi:hypothetical protein [Actinomycetospora termitidis]|uniref:Uncharacterized protein n=1 Tax=Actinomycetospora termitidis TaxID=3053470 RepID=A0ABT7M9E7_9PSEU|nr:hypothetical protein [Actinomycetospora sp. Odt1-22]MDL5157076.1 hypothetical protein [Actinomycetospora sp. Odt1-22]